MLPFERVTHWIGMARIEKSSSPFSEDAVYHRLFSHVSCVVDEDLQLSQFILSRKLCRC